MPGKPERLRFAGLGSDDQWSVQISGGLGPDMFHAARPVRAEIIVAKAVMLRLDDGLETRLQLCPLRGIDLDLEDRELNALAVILAGAGDLTQAFLAAVFQRVHVIGDQD